MSYEFQSCLYRTRGDLCDAIAEQWMTACGSNTDEFVREAFSGEQDDLALAREAIEDWNLDPQWQEERGIDSSHIAAGFSRLRANTEE